LIFALLVSASAARASDIPAPADPVLLQEAEKVAAAMGGDELFAPFFNRFAETMTETLVEWSGQPAAKVKAAVDQILMPDVCASDDLLHRYTVVLAESFTIDELKQIDAFETSAIGQRFRAIRPAMAKKFYDSEHVWIKESWPAIFKKHQNELSDLGIKKRENNP
jgi:hypothetical protein